MKQTSVRGSLRVSELGLGTAQLGNLSRVTTDDEAAGAVEAAWAKGIRYFDTAPHYGLGLSERRVGRALVQRPRKEFIVSTKVGRLLEPSPESAAQRDSGGFVVAADHRRVWDFSRDGVLRSIEESLRRLRMDSIDIVYAHDPDDFAEEVMNEALPALIELREQGVVRAVGAGMNQTAMLAEMIRRCDVDILMCAGRYTLLDDSAADELLPLALERDVALVAAGVYNSGLLSMPNPQPDSWYDYRPATRREVESARDIARLCERHGVKLPEAAIQFPLQHPAVAAVVVGCRDTTQVREAVARYRALIPPELWLELAALRAAGAKGGES